MSGVSNGLFFRSWPTTPGVQGASLAKLDGVSKCLFSGCRPSTPGARQVFSVLIASPWALAMSISSPASGCPSMRQVRWMMAAPVSATLSGVTVKHAKPESQSCSGFR